MLWKREKYFNFSKKLEPFLLLYNFCFALTGGKFRVQIYLPYPFSPANLSVAKIVNFYVFCDT